MEGAGLSRRAGGERVGVLIRCDVEVRPEPISAHAGAAQEVWLGFLRRLIPRPGQWSLPGALGARRKVSPIVWAFMVRTSVVANSGRFRFEQDVVGAAVAVAVVGSFDQGPAEVA